MSLYVVVESIDYEGSNFPNIICDSHQLAEQYIANNWPTYIKYESGEYSAGGGHTVIIQKYELNEEIR